MTLHRRPPAIARLLLLAGSLLAAATPLEARDPTARTSVAVVTVAATGPVAVEPDAYGVPESGTFTLTRTSRLDVAVRVRYTLAGTATNGVDYEMLPGVVMIPAGQTSVTVGVTPQADSLAERPETVVVTLVPGPSYVVGLPDTATVTIVDDPEEVTVASAPAVRPARFTATAVRR